MKFRALFSVTDKHNIENFADALIKNGFEIVASGGTANQLKKNGLSVTEVEEITSYPSILNGRVKTLHPKIFGGILADMQNESHKSDLANYDMHHFDLVVCNFYDFSSALNAADIHITKMIEKIDVGGPSMLRAAAKNFTSCIPVFSAGQYDSFIEHLKTFGTVNDIPEEIRLDYSAKAFSYTASYESMISNFFNAQGDDLMPETINLSLKKTEELRYGENPFQKAAVYQSGNENAWNQLQGKELSYNNYADIQTAKDIIENYDSPAVSIIKHSNPCGFGLGKTLTEAYTEAVSTDPISYFGGIVGINAEVDETLAMELKKSFLECIVAPSYSDEALAVLKKKKKLRLLTFQKQTGTKKELEYKLLDVGFLVQEKDVIVSNPDSWKIVTKIQPEKQDWDAIKLGWDLVKYVKSNAIVFSNNTKLLGVGAGQMSRVDSVKIAIRKSKEAGLTLEGSILASDAFFPFSDVVDIVKEYNIKGIIQPGGSIRDQDVIDACDANNLFMILTNERHFRH